MRPRAAPPLLPLLTFVLIACGSAATQAQPTATPTLPPSPGSRSFAMGISSLPPELNEESYEKTFELAGNIGEVLLIQRTPPWEELLDGRISEETARTTQREKDLAAEHGLDLFVAIDPTDSAEGRSELGNLPPELAGAGFSDENVRAAFLAYAQYVAENYRPKYLALGVEINGYQHRHPQDFEQFVTLYHEVYKAVKELAPETQVFPTFQFEELQGLLPTDQPYPPQWFLINRFEPELDLLALSSYPSLAFDAADEVPDGYYAQVRAYTDRPVAITGLGFSSEPAAGQDENGQALFLQKTLDGADQLEMPLVIWFVGQDPTFTGEAPFEKLAHIGLKRQNGTEKPAWLIWLATRSQSHAAQPTATPSDAPATGT